MRYNKATVFLWFLNILHFTPLSFISTLVQSYLIFYHIGFRKKVNVFHIFLLLIPSIVFISGTYADFGVSQYGSKTWLKFALPYLENAVFVGPIALSPKLLGGFGVVVRLIRHGGSTLLSIDKIFWLAALFLSIIGLFMAYVKGTSSAGGLTVGLRICLAIGVLTLPFILDRENFRKEVLYILNSSLILFLLGFLNAHWIFVMAGLVPFMIYINKDNFIIRVLAIIALFILTVLDFTFTIKITVFLSLLMVFIAANFQSSKILPRWIKSLRYLVISFPIVFVVLSILGFVNPIFTGLGIERLLDKFYEDRLPIWSATLTFIQSSNIWLVDAGRDILLWDYGIKGLNVWGAGAHNIYLEMARQVGLFSSLLLSVLIFYELNFLLKHYKLLAAKDFMLILSFLTVYLVYGITGNSLVYDGVGFLYWFILGQYRKLYSSL